MNTIVNNTFDLTKIKKLLSKAKFYDFFIHYIPGSFLEMKNEMTEIVAFNRKIDFKKARYVKNFKVTEVKKFIVDNDLQEFFYLEEKKQHS